MLITNRCKPHNDEFSFQFYFLHGNSYCWNLSFLYFKLIFMTPTSPHFPEISLKFGVASTRPPCAFPCSHAPPPRNSVEHWVFLLVPFFIMMLVLGSPNTSGEEEMKVRRFIYMISHSLFTKYLGLHALKHFNLKL